MTQNVNVEWIGDTKGVLRTIVTRAKYLLTLQPSFSRDIRVRNFLEMVAEYGNAPSVKRS